MFEADEGFFDVSGHGDGYCAVDVVPFEVHAKEYFAFPVNCACVLFTEVVNEVLGVIFVGITDSEVIEYQAENDGIGGMAEEAWRDAGANVSCWFQMGNEFDVSKASCLLEAIHSFSNFTT